jgi:hypothetical protein
MASRKRAASRGRGGVTLRNSETSEQHSDRGVQLPPRVPPFIGLNRCDRIYGLHRIDRTHSCDWNDRSAPNYVNWPRRPGRGLATAGCSDRQR